MYAVHRYLAEIMDKRLVVLTQKPQQILLIGADGDVSRRLLVKRFPQVKFSEYDSRQLFLDDAASQRVDGLWTKLSGKKVSQFCRTATELLPTASADMLWANLNLMTVDDLTIVFDNWAQALKTDGLLFFSHLGADTAEEIRLLLAQQGIMCHSTVLVDMHDLGDMLFHHGFYDPVMDTEKLILTYETQEALWRDLDYLGIWEALKLDNKEEARLAVIQAWQDGLLRQMTLETVFGHAVKRTILADNEQEVKFFAKPR